MDEIIQKIFKEYYKVLNHLLPNQHVSGVSSSSNLIDVIHLNNKNEAYLNSDYYVSVLNKKFIHFTNLEKFTNILLEKSVRPL